MSKRWIYFKAKVTAIVWLFKKLGFILSCKIFFNILRDNSKEYLIEFSFNNNKVKMLIKSERTDLAMLTEVFCFQSYEIRRKINPKLIVDGGANKGSTAVYFSIKYPEAKIHCYEPNIDLIPVLKKNIELNKIDAEIFNEALSDKSGMLFFEKNSNHQYSKLTNNNTEIKVKAISLTEKYIGKTIDILKLDIEGEEEKVISSLNFIDPNINVIIQEIHYDRVNSEKIFSLLKENNYKFENPYSQYYYLNSKVKYPILLAIHC